MPAVPDHTPNLGLPRFANDGAADFATDANSIVDAVDEATAPKVHSHTFWETKSFGIGGSVAVASGGDDPAFYIPPIRVRLHGGQTAKLARVEYKIASGTSVTFKVQINGADAPGFGGLVAGAAWSTDDAADLALADGDELSVVVTAVAGAPMNLSVGLVLEHTVS